MLRRCLFYKGRKGLDYVILLTICLCLFCVALVYAQDTSSESEQALRREGKLKAACLYYLSKFVSWPLNQTNSAKICILGEDPLNRFAQETMKGKTAHGQGIDVIKLEKEYSLQNLESCQILSIGEKEPKEISKIFTHLSEKPVLTVTSQADYTKHGGMVYIHQEGNKLKIKINKEKAENAGLNISSELLSLAYIVE